MTPRAIVVVPHTHWDREWYEPFEVVRYRLVKVIDHVLAVLEDEPAMRFTLDGQTVPIEDYLDIRPGAEADVADAIARGQLVIGPARVLPDGFLVSPETLVRNLQQGARVAARLGGRMLVGYLPDPFGHVSQMPQLLRLAGLSDACVWRGVPRAVDRTVFRWEAPDGSWVRAAYLPFGYGHGADLPNDPDALRERIARIETELEPFGPDGAIIVPNGSDHADVTEDLAARVAALADERVRIGSLADYLALLPEPDVVWRGELRSSARANLLAGVLSARLPLKRLEAATSLALERYAEPLAVLGGIDQARMLDRAWRLVVENAGHDSITGCGIDEVARSVESRYQDAARIAELIAADGLEALAGTVDRSDLADADEGVVVFNPGPRARGGAVEVTLTTPVDPGSLSFEAPDGTRAAVQPIEVTEQVALDMDVRGEQLAGLIPLVGGRRLSDMYVNDITIAGGRTTTVRLTMGMAPVGDFDVEAARASVQRLAATRPKGRFKVVGIGPPLVRMLVAVPSVPGVGWSTLRPVPDPARTDLTLDSAGIGNEHLRAVVAADGTVTITTTDGATYPGLLGIQDGGDAGDEYNWSPPERDLVITDPADVVVHEEHAGPVEVALRIERSYKVPVGLTNDGRGRARRTASMPVTTVIALRPGEPFLRVRVVIDNTARDHRTRLLLPLPFVAAGTVADGAFSVDERPREGEGGPHEAPTTTFPSRRGVAASDGERGLAVLHRGSPAYDLIDDRTLGITLVRSVGWLSTHGLSTRAAPAGPVVETPAAQVPGEHTIDLAVYPFAGDWRAAQVADVAESFAVPLRAVGTRAGSGDLPATGSALTITPGTVMLTALTREGGEVVVRAVNLSPEAVEATVRVHAPLPRARAVEIDLLGEERAPIDGADGVFTVPMRPWQIVTVSLR